MTTKQNDSIEDIAPSGWPARALFLGADGRTVLLRESDGRYRPVGELVAFRGDVGEVRLSDERLADCVRAEHAVWVVWLATLPEGSCGNPAPQALLDAEAATRAALDAVDGSERTRRG